MKRVLIITAALVAFAAPAGTAAAKTSKADKREAQKECRALRDASAEAFKAEWGSFGKCVSTKAHEAKAERKKARSNAAKDCRAERAEDEAAFKAKYRNFGKCVSEKAKAKRHEQDEDDAEKAEDTGNAAQQCAAERAADRKAFEDKYGTNHNKRNAFGKCVSQKAHEAGDDDGEGNQDDGS